MRLQLVPPVKTLGGEYEAKVHASTLSDSRVATDDKVIRIRLEEENPILGSLALASGFLLVVGGIVGLGVRLSRRQRGLLMLTWRRGIARGI